MAPNPLKPILDRLFPSLMDARRAYNLRRDNKKLFDARQISSRRAIYGDEEISVLTGPFKGMRYIDDRVWGPIEPRWLGTYESELHGVITTVIQRGYETVIDVGSAEGYYAVGLARACPAAIVFSYEVDPWSRRQQRQMCSLNGVSNLFLVGRCTHDEMVRRATDRTLLICDIEGFERDLLDPKRAPALMKIDILVEVHRCGDVTMKGMENHLRNRFSETHAIEVFFAVPRTVKDKEEIPASATVELAYLDEWRDAGQVWLWMQSRRSVDGRKS